jgi:hypothetical protein
VPLPSSQVKTFRTGRDCKQVALIPQCAECGEVWLPTDEDRWQAHLDTEDELVFF